MRFENPANGYVEKVALAPLWCLLFGCVYFAVKAVWTHAVASLLLAFCTAGISWLLYPFFATQIMKTHYLRRGWLEIPDSQADLFIGNTMPSPGKFTLGRVLIALLLVFGALIIAGAWSAHSEREAIRNQPPSAAPVSTTAPKGSAPIPRARPAANSQN